MKTVFIFRHGKSSWEEPALRDFDRPLLPKGEKRTRRMAEFMKNAGYIPQLIVSSPATRALQTAEILSTALGSKLLSDDSLYLCSQGQIADLIYSLENELQSVMIVGHNPAVTDFAADFLGVDCDWLPTSGLAMAVFDAEKWSSLPVSNIKENLIVRPKTLK